MGPQVQFGFQPIQTATGQPAQRPTQFSPQPQRPPPGFQFNPQTGQFQQQQPQRPPPGFQFQQQPQQFQQQPQQFQQRPQPPQGPPRPAQAGAPQNRPFTAFSGGVPQQLQFGQPQPQRPQSSSPFAVFNPSLLRGARNILAGR